MRVLPLIVSATGLAGAVAAIAFSAYSLRMPEPPSDPAREIRESVPGGTLPEGSGKAIPATPPQTAVAKLSGSAAPPGPRAVAPTVVAVPPVDPNTLERVDPRPPLSELATAAPPRKPPPKPLLFQPVAESAGVISAGGRTITISGVEVVADDEACERPGAGNWPCGRAARTAFRAFLRGRAVTCDFPEGEVPDRLISTCRVGKRDIGAWLVENGWARPAGSAYPDEARAAREAARGVYGAGPAQLPAELSAPVADEVTASPEPTTEGPDDISILPDRTATGATGEQLPAAPPADDAGADGLSPLPAPSSPLR